MRETSFMKEMVVLPEFCVTARSEYDNRNRGTAKPPRDPRLLRAQIMT